MKKVIQFVVAISLLCMARAVYAGYVTVPTTVEILDGDDITVTTSGRLKGPTQGGQLFEEFDVDQHMISIKSNPETDPSKNVNMVDIVQGWMVSGPGLGADLQFSIYAIIIPGGAANNLFLGFRQDPFHDSRTFLVDLSAGEVNLRQYIDGVQTHSASIPADIKADVIYRIALETLPQGMDYLLIQRVEVNPVTGERVHTYVITENLHDLGFSALLPDASSRGGYFVGTRGSNAKFWGEKLTHLQRDWPK